MMNKIKWPDLKTPSRRFAIAFWLGYAFHFTTLEMIRNFTDRADEFSGVHWGVWVVLAFVVLFFYTKNRLNFEKEQLWMTIKNPAKVTVEQGEADKYAAFGIGVKAGRPSHPPPGLAHPKAPPKPPTRKFK